MDWLQKNWKKAAVAALIGLGGLIGVKLGVLDWGKEPIKPPPVVSPAVP